MIVSCYQRTTFATVDVQAQNPFSDIKIKAVFLHSSGARFEMPVVCTQSTAEDANAWAFPVIFTPHILGDWSWHLDSASVVAVNGASILNVSSLPTLSAPQYFTCKVSNLRGWRRPDIDMGAVGDPLGGMLGSYRRAVIEPKGDGTFAYHWPVQSTFYSLVNPIWSSGDVMEAVSWMKAAGVTRARFALTSVTRRSVQNSPSNPNHTVFARTGSTFQPTTNVDFSRFDLGQWTLIDGMIATLAAAGIDAVIIVMFNSGSSDYEEEFLYERTAPNVELRRQLLLGTSAFSHFDDRYFWYLAGRLSSYTNVEWCVGHEWDSGSSLTTGPDGRYTSDTVAAIGRKLASSDPYLTWNSHFKIINTVPRRGSFYLPDNQALSGLTGKLSETTNPFLGVFHDDWRSCIGLQRGGELGITSVVSMDPLAPSRSFESANPGLTGAGSTFDYPCNSAAVHRHPGVNLRPIFIEEDWISRNEVEPNQDPNDPLLQPGVALSFTSIDNPYAKFIGTWPPNTTPIPIGRVGAVVNPNAFPFITNNFAGLRKAIRDQAWMCGVVCQAYTSYWTRKFAKMSDEINSVSWQPYVAIRDEWVNKTEWWRFSFDASLVLSQSHLAQLPGGGPVSTLLPPGTISAVSWPFTCMPVPPVPPLLPSLPSRLSGIMTPGGRPPFEQLAIGAKSDHGAELTQYVVYCPVGGAVATVTLDLSDLGAGLSFAYYFINPDTGKRSPSSVLVTPVSGPLHVTFPVPPLDQQGEFGEYVLVVNVP